MSKDSLDQASTSEIPALFGLCSLSQVASLRPSFKCVVSAEMREIYSLLSSPWIFGLGEGSELGTMSLSSECKSASS